MELIKSQSSLQDDPINSDENLKKVLLLGYCVFENITNSIYEGNTQTDFFVKEMEELNKQL
eukprot:CAMPEP_0170539842 /NCGR_PEP_ID=MMETSP0209-20121228/104248_1 /TAXON_ID=665100 ORGANISM="Litonotus pictus, Strain P1" /NCGR_SAMPLE_ID=MMETSP0209 /ASSEMBLY_ACC=CAM_ASM_000301 /LENGTH=60 /DNA_ID=CAMNT_0010842003 /DNA_START=1068 /DNA_END=1247 /DNA_ORIENTATION=+